MLSFMTMNMAKEQMRKQNRTENNDPDDNRDNRA